MRMYTKILRSTPKVLVIDDDKDFSNIVCAVARYQGVDAVPLMQAGTISSVIANYDLVILDLAMPGTNGVDVLRQIAEQKITTKVVLLSGVSLDLLEHCKRFAKNRGVQVVNALSKPIRVSELKDCFKTLMLDRVD